MLCALLGACAQAPRVAEPAPDLWLDDVFDFRPSLVKATRESIFELDPALDAHLRATGVTSAPTPRRLEALVTLVFGPDMKAFDYVGGRTTNAAETWRNKQGDCLSLTILSQALARRLGVPAQMQEVRVPVTFDRRNGVDFLNNHVNLLVRNDQRLELKNRSMPPGEFVIDFDPQIGSTQRGNGAERRRDPRALLQQPGRRTFGQRQQPSGLCALQGRNPRRSVVRGQLRQSGAVVPACRSRSARRALAAPCAAALNERRRPGAWLDCTRLLLSQGRGGRSAVLEAALQARRDQDPYYWLGLGLGHLQQERYPTRRSTRSSAPRPDSGFDEVHRYLALAYWRVGKPQLARDQSAILSALSGAEASVAALSRKFTAAHGSAAQPD